MKFGKKLALLLAVILTVSVLGACNTNSGNTGTAPTETQSTQTPAANEEAASNADLTKPSPEVESVVDHEGEPITLTVYSQLANYAGEQIGWGADVLLEKFNVKFNIIPESDGTFATRMESGDLGDIVIFGDNGGGYQDAAAAGMLFNWEEDGLLDDYGAYIKENFELPLEQNRSLTGTVYGYGHNVAFNPRDHEAFFYYPHLRWDLYDKIGRPEVNTLEDFVPVLEQMVALEPTDDNGSKTYGVSLFPDWDGTMVMMVKSTGALYGWDEFGLGLYNVETQEYQGALEEGGMYLRALKFYNTLFQKGLLDPDSMTQTFDDMSKKYASGAAMFNIFEWMASSYNTPAHKEAGKVMQPIAAKDQKNLVYGVTIFGGNRVWTIGSKTAYPELCMEIINWMSTPEGVLTVFYGPKGVTWDLDENGDPMLTELGLAAQLDKENTSITYAGNTGTYKNGEYQHNNTNMSVDAVNPDSPSGYTFNYRFWPSTNLRQTVTPVEQAWRDYTGKLSADEYLIDGGHMSVAIGSAYAQNKRDTELETTWTQVGTCIKDGSWSAIYAPTDAEFDAIVAKMISDAKSYGYDACDEWSRNEAARRKVAEDDVKAMIAE
ncbi:MAG: hypothetical protein LBS21_00070 [Clostridiales bacterium]|jgi:multiple sugar transport system substrate-binding protein/putative aldouronate transport system substrate-binding protein|nr:hypothetical protein [Clostridiales bacterium]